jgi:hypothetical protein
MLIQSHPPALTGSHGAAAIPNFGPPDRSYLGPKNHHVNIAPSLEEAKPKVELCCKS